MGARVSKRIYRVGGVMTISVFVDVEAESPEQAREAAQDQAIMSLCHQCSGNHPGEWSTSGELDGDVTLNGEDDPPIDMGPAPARGPRSRR
jgi:hypothetical protein